MRRSGSSRGGSLPYKVMRSWPLRGVFLQYKVMRWGHNRRCVMKACLFSNAV